MKHKECPVCKGKGIVNWSSKYSSPGSQSGEIVIPEISICGECRGCGINRIPTLERCSMSPEEWYNTRDETDKTRNV